MKKILVPLLAFVLFSCSTKDDINVKDYPIITTVHELAEYYDLRVEKTGKYESTSITNYFDGSVELDYEYDSIDSESFEELFYSVTVEKQKTVQDAKEVFSLGKGALNLVGNSFDQGTVEIDSLQLPGDDSYYALRTFEGEPNGMFYIVRKGTRVYTMVISGLYTPDHSLVTELLLPKIASLEGFEIIEK